MKGRGPVVHLDRSRKARMIEAILSDHLKQPVSNFTMLDIGCGNGGISEHFARSNKHHAVDIHDNRTNKHSKFDFQIVDSERLPYPDGYFDIVIAHHVIEHVNDQTLHLDEIHRVLKSSGIAYLATPNRSSPIMEGHIGNNRVLRYREMAPLFRCHGFDCTEYGYKVAKQPDRFYGEVRQARHIPSLILKALRPAFPSHMFILEKR